MVFAWDEQKATTNRTKHGVSFVRAAEVFEDPNRIVEFNRVAGNGEL